ncbi:uncharacterized protein MELLADRAFT_113774 [Melampsora larici-populina 98AG31]|uniref:Uncharacterized protein n=1 Tax=Melampsora larici-populina (strain 98AG31 / pathotype 3-4-7) TaxID=747676 RepID=F4SB08_MELLP|nr:uncharacterized protein MELLADRAFT_113774 [Melampsora larici-populina 98AG31]EGF98170.1 hypothetical protein MELLADRAFT_113774 [Melampsora larici-populina 98AG31]
MQPQLGIETSTLVQIEDEDSNKPLDLAPYLPIFQELVNMNKVRKHFERGCLGHCQDIHIEKKGRATVNKIVKQLHLINTQFDIEFHLLVSSFNPKTKLAKELWTEEHNSCNWWAELVQNEHHLLENFAKEPTKCPSNVFKKPKVRAAPIKVKEQTCLRTELTLRLNQLVVCLQVHRTHDCQITNTMLEKGAAPGNMSLADVRLWLEEIAEGRYAVVVDTEQSQSVNVSNW